jgi:hypothetical protein
MSSSSSAIAVWTRSVSSRTASRRSAPRAAERRLDRGEVAHAHELPPVGLDDRTLARQHAVESFDHHRLDREAVVERGAERAAVERAEHTVARPRALRKEEQAASARARGGDTLRDVVERRQLADIALEEAREPRHGAEDRHAQHVAAHRTREPRLEPHQDQRIEPRLVVGDQDPRPRGPPLDALHADLHVQAGAAVEREARWVRSANHSPAPDQTGASTSAIGMNTMPKKSVIEPNQSQPWKRREVAVELAGEPTHRANSN